jgi:anti-sigma B factor antagonist
MKIELRSQDGFQVVALHGEVDMHSATGLRERLLTALKTPSGLIVDMSEVSFIDSSGIAILVEGYKRAKQNSQTFALAGVRAAPMQVLQLTRLDKVFPLFQDVASATKLTDTG